MANKHHDPKGKFTTPAQGVKAGDSAPAHHAPAPAPAPSPAPRRPAGMSRTATMVAAGKALAAAQHAGHSGGAPKGD